MIKIVRNLLVLGAAFGRIVTSLVEDVLMPPIGLALGGVDFRNLFVDLSRGGYATLAEAQAAGAPTLRYGMFINTIVNFLIVAFTIFLLVRQANRMFPSTAPASAPVTRDCPYCLSAIPLAATGKPPSPAIVVVTPCNSFDSARPFFRSTPPDWSIMSIHPGET